MALIRTNLQLALETDRFPHEHLEPEAFKVATMGLFTWLWDDGSSATPLGYVQQKIVDEMQCLPERLTSWTGHFQVNEATRTIQMFSGPTIEERSAGIEKVMQHWRRLGKFPILQTWRDEPWPVYDGKRQLCHTVERAAAGLLGVNRYGVHMTAYVKSPSSIHGIKMWVAKRATTKSSFPSMLDNTVAGGLMAGEHPLECIIREADEEASLPEALVRNLIKPVGTLSYVYVTDEAAGGEAGLIYPECQWVYDLELSESVVPSPKDGEVESFTLSSVDAIQQQLGRGEFKPNCALVVLDFFIRHGIMTRENEPDFDRIRRHLHRRLPFPSPHEL